MLRGDLEAFMLNRCLILPFSDLDPHALRWRCASVLPCHRYTHLRHSYLGHGMPSHRNNEQARHCLKHMSERADKEAM